MDSPYRRELQVVFEAIQVATAISRTVLSALRSEQEGEQNDSVADASLHVLKTDLSPVTAADLAIQGVLAQVLSHVFPSHRIVAEESGDPLRASPALLRVVHRLAVDHARASPFVWSNGGSALESADRVLAVLDRAASSGSDSDRGIDPAVPTWIIDPIDGTQAFVRGEQYAINVALVVGARQQLGVVACPLLALDVATAPVAAISDETIDPTGRGSLLFAVRGHGAFIKPLSLSPDSAGAERQITRLTRRDSDSTDATASGTSSLRNVTSFGRVDSGLSPAIHAAVAETLSVPFPGCNLVSWVLRWAALALGLADVTVWVYKSRSRCAKIWDHAGAMLLFEEVGGRVTDVDGRDIDLSRGRLLTANFGFVAAPRNVHHVVLAATRDVLRREGKSELLLEA